VSITDNRRDTEFLHRGAKGPWPAHAHGVRGLCCGARSRSMLHSGRCRRRLLGAARDAPVIGRRPRASATKGLAACGLSSGVDD